MATGTAQRGPQATPPARKADGRWLEYDRFIDTQLRKARGQVKGVELAGSLMTLAAAALFAAYKLFSPKDPIDTVGRIVMPWADIQAPTRVTILDVQPGGRIAYLGETVEISAEVRGVGTDEPVRVLYTTGDRQTV